jgi:hypothetical protein
VKVQIRFVAGDLAMGRIAQHDQIRSPRGAHQDAPVSAKQTPIQRIELEFAQPPKEIGVDLNAEPIQRRDARTPTDPELHAKMRRSLAERTHQPEAVTLLAGQRRLDHMNRARRRLGFHGQS